MVRIGDLCIDAIKQILHDKQLSTSGTKAELIQIYIEATGSEEVPVANSNMQEQLNEMRRMIESLTTKISEISANGAIAQVPVNIHQSSNSFDISQNTVSESVRSVRSVYTVKEIAESIPEFDPMDMQSIAVEHFVERVNAAVNAYKWDEKGLMLAVFGKMKGAAKWWLDASSVVYSNWADFSRDLVSEFGLNFNEAEVHHRMSAASRRNNENVIDYCFRISSLGRRFLLSEQAIIRYIRDGLRHRELQSAIAAMKFRSIKELREHITEFFQYNPVNAREVFAVKSNTENMNKNIQAVDSKTAVKCYNCGEIGHISSKCSKPPRRPRCMDCNKVHAKGEAQNCGKAKPIRQTMCNDLEKVFEKSVFINERGFIAFVDTGSHCSLMRKSVADSLNITQETCVLKISGICGGERFAIAKSEIIIAVDDVIRSIQVFIVDDEILTHDLLIGQNIFHDVNFTVERGIAKFVNIGLTEKLVRSKNNEKLPINNTDIAFGISDVNVQNDVINLVNEYRDIFACGLHEIGKTNSVEMKITLTTNEPVVQQPYRVSEPKRVVVSKMINELLENDIIQTSESEYASPITLVKKKNGQDRLCIDYRKLNNFTKKEIFPMPNIEETLHDAKRYRLFCALDLNSGYYQVPIAKECRKYTAFVTTEGLYEFKRMPFGLKNAPAVFQRLMAKVKDKTEPGDMIHYMDDILIAGNTRDEIMQKLRRVFTAIRELSLTLNIGKCIFFRETIEFLGHQIVPEGITPGKLKTLAISNFKVPTSVTEVRKFLGLSGYFRKFVPHYAILSEPLRLLLRKDQPFIWGREQNESFDRLKLALTSQPVIAAFRLDAEHQLHTDASAVGLAGVLLQREGDSWKPVIYYSRSTTVAERHYHSYELECLAVVESLERMKYYIQGKPIIVVTDCSAIRTVMTKRELVPRIARWWLRIQDYEIKIEHRAGNLMCHVDAMSRAPVESSQEKEPASLRIGKVNVDNNDWLFSLQLQDEKVKAIIDSMNQQKISRMDGYILDKGRLYRLENNKKLWVIPKCVRYKILHESHDKAGHMGVDKTIDRIKQNMWFPRMRNFTKSYINSCVDCAYNKKTSGKKEGEYHYSEVEPIPFKTIHLDHLGPFPRSSLRNEHILVIVDPFTKFTIVRAVKSTATKHVIDILCDVFSYFGTPKRIITDRGTAFTSNSFKTFCFDNDIVHILNAVRTPRANGQAERVNRTLISMLRTTTTNDKRWDTQLRDLQWSLNTMKNDTTGKTPQELLFSYQPRDTLCSKVSLTLQSEQPSETVDIESIRKAATERIAIQREKSKQRFDSHHAKPTVYKEGDIVLAESELSSTGEPRKLEPRYKGPFVVSKVLGNDRYVIKDLRGVSRTKKAYTTVFTSEKLKPFNSTIPDDDSESLGGMHDNDI